VKNASKDHSDAYRLLWRVEIGGYLLNEYPKRPRHESGLSRTLGEEGRLPLPGPPKQLQAARTLALKRSRFALP
jgi:hypothetical protein